MAPILPPGGRPSPGDGADSSPVFLSGSLFRHVAVMSLTSSVGLMAVFLVDLADMVFIAMLGQAELAAAIGYGAAILFFTTSFGIGMAIAAGALVARAVGSGQRELARQRATHALIHGVGFGAVFAAVVWMLLPEIVALLGATGRTADLTILYLAIIIPSLPLLIVGMIGGAILRAHGDARRAMIATLLGAAVNAVLDPILIFGFGLELVGAAMASVAARATIAAVALLPILRHHGGFCRPTAGGLVGDLRTVAAIALPAILTQLATPVGQAYVTRAMSEHGEAAVAGLAVISRLIPVAFGVLFALSGAVGPIIGQNAGAGRDDRVRGALSAAIWFTALVTAGMAAVLFLFRGPLADLFQADGRMRDLIFLFCGPLALLWFFNGVIFVANAAFNNLGRPFLSTWVNWGRHTLGTVPFVMFGAWLAGAEGVLIGQAVGGVLFAGIAWFLAVRLTRDPSGGAGLSGGGPLPEPVSRMFRHR